jgi:hypothetical protein
MEPIIVKLTTPVTTPEGEITEIKFPRRLIAKDFAGMGPELDQVANMLLISRVTATPLVYIEKLDGYDYLQVFSVVQLFLGSGPKAGDKLLGK